MDQVYAQITTIVTYVIAALTGILAVDHLAYLMAKLFGNTKIETLCTNIALKIQSAITKAKTMQLQPSQPEPVVPVQSTPASPVPPITAAVLAICLSFALYGVSRAQVTSNTPAISISGTINSALNSVDVPTQIQTIKNSGLAVNTGFWYDWKAAQIDATFTYPVFGSRAIGTWGTWDYINFGYASPDVLIGGTGLDINIGAITSKWNLPANVKTILNSASIGFTPMIGIEKIGSKNRFTGGPGAFVKITF